MRFPAHIVRTVTALAALVLFAGISDAGAAIEYIIRKGDNPSSIAKKHKVKVKDIMSANRVSSKNMKPGTRIIIPSNKVAVNRKMKKVKAGKKVQARVKKPRADDNTADDRAGTVISAARISGDMYHVVGKGDTLASISKKYSISAAELKELNKLKTARLKKGKRLLVKRIGPKTYTVKKGDNIWRIAKKFDVDADDLMELNEMNTPDLHVGQKLYLEEIVDAASTETIAAVVPRNFEEEIRKVAETEEFQEKDSPNKVVDFAKKLINIPYKFGGNSILGIDCSAYVKKVYGLLGVELPRTAREQFKTGEAIEMDELSVGDLVFFRTYASFPSHVGIYLGNNLFIHASSRGKKVTIDSLETPYYLKRFIGGKRLLTEREPEDKDQNSPS